VIRHSSSASGHAHRPQASDVTDGDDVRPLVVRPLVHTDRLHNPRDVTVDDAAIAAGVAHGGMVDTPAQALARRGAGGRKGPRGARRRRRVIER
jgi:hypothetical protein